MAQRFDILLSPYLEILSVKRGWLPQIKALGHQTRRCPGYLAHLGKYQPKRIPQFPQKVIKNFGFQVR
jgi:hypothetical protein